MERVTKYGTPWMNVHTCTPSTKRRGKSENQCYFIQKPQVETVNGSTVLPIVQVLEGLSSEILCSRPPTFLNEVELLFIKVGESEKLICCLITYTIIEKFGNDM
ncbi:hypothetical protein LOAG_01841 [Loa loa]|uniref:Uncharacterized protein n=1 Tax=Loa loa TaxID=7209 RepID=A0A1S0U8D3_LOALO|nr:hypothetical protein LOAG_01841 [Loa loa]EFO26646.1 hypothetical protein LOAG_01841 [Loa loa]